MTIIISIMMMMISLLVDDERRKLLNFFEKRQTQFWFLSIGAISGTEERPWKKGWFHFVWQEFHLPESWMRKRENHHIQTPE